MCECSGKLVTWMDGELPRDEASRIEHHLEACEQCRARVNSYRRASAAFRQYSVAASGAERPAAARHVLVAAAAVVAAAAALLLAPRRAADVPQERAVARAVAAPVPVVPVKTQMMPEAAAGARGKHAGRNNAVTQHKDPSSRAAALPAPAIEVAIPSDAIFPPGAVPEGFSFVADVSVGADGSAERVRLEPRLVEFEGRRP